MKTDKMLYKRLKRVKNVQITIFFTIFHWKTQDITILRKKIWTPTTPAKTEDAQFFEDHLIDDESYEELRKINRLGDKNDVILFKSAGSRILD